MAPLQLHVPLTDQAKFAGVVLGEYSIDGLLRYGVPAEVSAQVRRVAAGSARAACWPATRCRRATRPRSCCRGRAQPNEYEVPVSPVGNGLIVRAQAYRTSLGVIGSGLFWLVGALSAHDGLDADRATGATRAGACRRSRR